VVARLEAIAGDTGVVFADIEVWSGDAASLGQRSKFTSVPSRESWYKGGDVRRGNIDSLPRAQEGARMMGLTSLESPAVICR
jgi:hypothetical protein